MNFTFRRARLRDRHFSNSSFRQNNKWLNDEVSRPPWFQEENGTTSLRQPLQMAPLYKHPLHLSPSHETLANLKDRLILI